MAESVIISGSNVKKLDEFRNNQSTNIFFLGQTEVGCSLLDVEDPSFAASEMQHRKSVLVKKIGFSCNYRDKTLILQTALQANARNKQNPDDLYFSCIGSDFVAEITDVGSEVTKFRKGDRVIPDNSYPINENPEAFPGIPTNEASSRLQVFHECKLLKIPPAFDLNMAAGFSIGAQTTYSIMKKLHLHKDSMILVTSANSNTSLFLLGILKNHNNVFLLSSSDHTLAELKKEGFENGIKVNYSSRDFFEDSGKFKKMISGSKGFDVIVDPFIDVHLPRIIGLTNFNAQYITCGIFNQSNAPGVSHLQTEQFYPFFVKLIEKNITVQGNCLGTSHDLQNAIDDVATGKFKPIIDSVFENDDVVHFFNRNYNDAKRLGKVIYRYQD